MLKKTITYENPFTDKEVTEEHYFHISKADLVEMEMEEHDNTYESDGKTLTGMQAKLQRIIDARDGKAIMAELKDILRRSYGRKEGDRFIKTQAIWEEFVSTEAFSQLFFELCTNAEAASEFMNGVVPHNLDKIADDIREQAAQAQSNGDSAQPDMGPRPEVTSEKRTQREHELASATPENPVTLTRVEVEEMSGHDLKNGLADGRFQLS